ncbi:hypothetical protein D0817_20175 [Flavobacterium cupreum]|uniref:Uncharacterized protein n=2 Tax=Flavobacterium TaxID=237 RepID=A0A434A2P7_9FLAO|nr:hypothetical protein [Flavobacterium cupreum]RUT68679.1 hypothetical protein D0817_20175 [Flavobacterium cupreum]
MKTIINKIKAYFKQRKLRKELRRQTINRVVENYEALINELRLIQENKSKLYRSQREFVQLRIKHLISKGHIQVNK